MDSNYNGGYEGKINLLTTDRKPELETLIKKLPHITLKQKYTTKY